MLLIKYKPLNLHIMKFLTPEIEALSKHVQFKSLVRSTISCGIFQDLDYSEPRPKLYHQKY
jgi:hypothetical protein